MVPDNPFEELKASGALPSPSGIGMQILLLAKREDCTVDDVLAILRGDPGLTAKVLRLAHSVTYGVPDSGGSIADVANRIGLARLKNAAVGLSLVESNLRGSCDAFDYETFWRWSLATAVGAQVFSEEVGGCEGLDAFLCALLSRLGRMTLANLHGSAYAGILNGINGDLEELEKRERAAFGMTNREVTAALAAEWRLPRRYAEVLEALADNGDSSLEDAESFRLFQAVHFGQIVGDLFVSSEFMQPRIWMRLRDDAGGNDVGPEDLQAIWTRIDPQAREWCALFEMDSFNVLGVYELEERADRLVSQERRIETDFQRPDAKSVARVDPSQTRILAVDDDPVSLRLLVRHLKREGYSVTTARNGMDALDRVKSDDPHIVVTDWMMPELDGIELCKRLRTLPDGNRLYILLLTGQAEEDQVVQAFDAGADDYVTKPFKPKILMARIRGGQRVIELQKQVEEDKKVLREKNARQAAMARKLRIAAMTDPLTQLPNRRFAMKSMETFWAHHEDRHLSVIMLDIDRFKLVNDEYGHDVGDAVLRETANAIRSVLRKGDDCARMGGEEFLILCPGTDLDGAMHLAERVRNRVETNVVHFADFHRHVTVSLGVAQRLDGMRNLDELLKVADEAVYLAKNTGRNRVVPGIFDAGRRAG